MNKKLIDPFRAAFHNTHEARRVAFMPFLVAGDPDMKRSLAIFKAVSKYADMLEIGFPYSDPLADGPTIQAADERALKSGINTAKVFDLIKQLRGFYKKPVTVLVYANIVYQYGVERFYKTCANAGIQGVLIPDVPYEEAAPFVANAKKYGVCPIFMITRTTTAGRLRNILKYAEGYLYLVSVLGVTGSRNSLQEDPTGFIKSIRKQTSLPLALGFGISKAEQIEQAARAGIDGVIAGSAIINVIENHLENPAAAAEAFIKGLLRPLEYQASIRS